MSALQTDTPDWPKQALEGQDARDGEACLDWALIQRTLAGEQKAYELLVIKYQKRIERLVARMLRDANQVPDVVQETFINAYRALHQFRGDARFYTWLHRIAVNTTYKALQEKKRNPLVSFSDLSPDNEDEHETFSSQVEPTSDETPEAVVAARQVAEAMNAAMQALPPESRQALELREMEGLSYEEIAQLMDIPIGTVRSRIFRAREAIAAKVGPLLEHRSGKRW